MNWLQKHLAVICMVFGLISAFFVLISWGIGYYANGLYGYHFDVGSCWTGLGAIGTGLVGLFKWLIDSRFNSFEGYTPGKEQSNESTSTGNQHFSEP